MAHRYPFGKDLVHPGHWPTAMLAIGTVAFWIELYVLRRPYGQTSLLAWFCWGAVVASGLYLWRRHILRNVTGGIAGWRGLKGFDKVIAVMFAAAALAYGGIVLYASSLPVHLIQESDALDYHLMLPRQHLILQSFSHIPWSVPDLFLLPLDYALAPFALTGPMPNKWPQLVFFAGALMCVYQIMMMLSRGRRQLAWMAVMGVMACHAMAIQAATAMMDVVMLYCFLACVRSLYLGQYAMAGVEFSLYFWSKAFIPLQVISVGLILLVLVFVLRKQGWQLTQWPAVDSKRVLRFAGYFTAVSAVVALPHLIKSLYYTGTPLYPFGFGLLPHGTVDLAVWTALKDRVADLVAVKDMYGHGRSWLDFVKHFWLIAVPERGVNNAYDYPMGLVYLLVLGPFLIQMGAMFKHKQFPVLSMVVVMGWLTWWFGSQQSRFVLLPVVLMIMVSIAAMKKPNKYFLTGLVLAILIEVISLANAHRSDWGKRPSEVIRPKDKQLLELKHQHTGSGPIVLDFADVAFSPIAVHAKPSSKVLFVIP